MLLISVRSQASLVSIGIFNDSPIRSIVLTTQSGNYTILLDSLTKINADTNDVFYLTLVNDSLQISTLEKNLGKFKRIDFAGDYAAVLKLKATSPSKPAKKYPNSFSFCVVNHQFKIINRLDLENYVSGVVEVEAGSRQTLEYYKVQAIICRTYALSNMRRHEEAKFNLCDNVHCQVYKGFNQLNPDIEAAVKQTKNLVLVDRKSELITTAFHSNCGGQTCNSEDVWGLSKPYLRSISDTFCLQQRNAKWTKLIPQEQWLSYIAQNCKPCSYDSSKLCCDFIQENRKNYFEISHIQLPVKNIRNDLKLKSAYFSISEQNDSVLFTGRGYGHGVGLCQEGAIQMAKLGYSYSTILHFYYRDVDIINLNQLHFFKE